PNAAAWANGEAAPLLTLPLIRKPSTGAWLDSGAAAPFVSAGAFAPSPDAFASVRWKPLCCGTGACAVCFLFPFAIGADGADGAANVLVTCAGEPGEGAEALISSNDSSFNSHCGLGAFGAIAT